MQHSFVLAPVYPHAGVWIVCVELYVTGSRSLFCCRVPKGLLQPSNCIEGSKIICRNLRGVDLYRSQRSDRGGVHGAR